MRLLGSGHAALRPGKDVQWWELSAALLYLLNAVLHAAVLYN
jgi:hypothetical protein